LFDASYPQRHLMKFLLDATSVPDGEQNLDYVPISLRAMKLTVDTEFDLRNVNAFYLAQVVFASLLLSSQLVIACLLLLSQLVIACLLTSLPALAKKESQTAGSD